MPYILAEIAAGLIWRFVYDGDYGLLPSDEEFGTVVSRVLQDESRRIWLAGRGLRRAAEFSLDAMLDRYEDVLLDLSASHANPVASH